MSRPKNLVGLTTKIPFADFVLKMIQVNAVKSGYAGLHTVFPLAWADGASFNAIAMTEFGIDKPTVIAAIDHLVTTGKVVRLPAKGGVRLYSPDNAPTRTNADANASVMATVAKLVGDIK